MVKGGYQILDFKGYNFTKSQAVETTTSGIKVYNLIEGTNKRTIVSGLVIANVEYRAIEVNFSVSSSNMVGKFYLGSTLTTITITSDDTITIS